MCLGTGSSPPTQSFVREKTPILSTKTNALLWLLYSLAPKYGQPVVLNQHLAGLAAMLKMSEKGVKQGVERLIQHGLIEQVGTTFFLKQPTPETLAFWEDRPVRQETAFRLTKHFSVRLIIDDDDPDAARKKEDVDSINEMLDLHGTMMHKAGCPRGEIIEYWRYVLKHNTLGTMWEYVVVDFESAFKYHAAQHRANGYSGSPMKLLWKKIRERFPEQEPSPF